MQLKDTRLKIINEILNGIKVEYAVEMPLCTNDYAHYANFQALKFYAWEESFEKKVLGIREQELTVLKKAAYFGATNLLIWICSPILVSEVCFLQKCINQLQNLQIAVAVFACYVLMDPANNILTPEKAFVSLTLFSILKLPLTLMPEVAAFLMQVSAYGYF